MRFLPLFVTGDWHKAFLLKSIRMEHEKSMTAILLKQLTVINQNPKHVDLLRY